MNPIIKDGTGKIIYTLSAEEVIQLHQLLNFHPEILKLTEPVSPSGVKNEHLLESAVSRQNVGFGDKVKYNTAYSNCATLVYGIAKNHAFHNGNKRAALLSLIKHLHKNGLLLKSEVSNDEVYAFLSAVASSELRDYAYKYDRRLHNSAYKNKSTNSSIEPDKSVDADIYFMERWLQKNSISKHDSDRPLKWNHLIKKLAEKGIMLEGDLKPGKIYLKKQKSSFWGYKTYHKFCYTYKNEVCPKQTLKSIRKDFKLSHQDGFDFDAFYDEEVFMSQEIILFKRAIYRLSKN